MEEQLYSIGKRTNTEEYHIFLSTKDWVNNCHNQQTCICKKMNLSQGDIVSSCKNEQKIRVIAAGIGRQVCGTCVSHLYETF